MRLMISLTLFAFAMFGFGNAIVSAQDDQRSQPDIELTQELERKLEADLAALQRARKSQQKPQNKSNRKHQNEEEQQLEAAAAKIEAWAAEHSDQWESWAEKFEQKMEKWADSQENQWEKWADDYSEQWEDWAEKIESGEIKPEEIEKLVQANLKMLNEMPLGKMIDGALKEGLGELKNMPIEHLGELHELIGGSLEQALGAMEKEISGAVAGELKNALGNLETGELKKAINLLQNSIQIQQHQIDGEAKEKIMELKELLKNKAGLDEKKRDEIRVALERELVDAVTIKKKQIEKALQAQSGQLKKQAAAHADQAKVMQEMMKKLKGSEMKALAAKTFADSKRSEAMVKQAVLMAKKAEELAKRKMKQSPDARKKAEMIKREAQAKAIAKAKANIPDQYKKSVEQYYSNLKAQQENLKEKESEIESMRREIRELRKLVEKMSKDKD